MLSAKCRTIQYPMTHLFAEDCNCILLVSEKRPTSFLCAVSCAWPRGECILSGINSSYVFSINRRVKWLCLIVCLYKNVKKCYAKGRNPSNLFVKFTRDTQYAGAENVWNRQGYYNLDAYELGTWPSIQPNCNELSQWATNRCVGGNVHTYLYPYALIIHLLTWQSQSPAYERPQRQSIDAGELSDRVTL